MRRFGTMGALDIQRGEGQMAGRPKGRQQEAELRAVWTELCDYIAAGDTDSQALARFGIINTTIFYRLMRNEAELAAEVERAREAGADAMASEALDIVDDLLELPGQKVSDAIKVAEARANRRAWLAGTRNTRYAPRQGGNVAVQVNVQALHLQALKGQALPAPELQVIEGEVIDRGEVEGIADLL